MNISTNYTGKTNHESFIKFKRLVIPKVPINIVRALRQQSLNAKRNIHQDIGSAAGEALFYIYEGLRKRKVNVDELLKSK
jgi:hypothetical protein